MAMPVAVAWVGLQLSCAVAQHRTLYGDLECRYYSLGLALQGTDTSNSVCLVSGRTKVLLI